MNAVPECMDVTLVFHVYKYLSLIHVSIEFSMIEIKILKSARVHLVSETTNFITNATIPVKNIFKPVCTFN